MHVYVQNWTTTTWPRRPAGVSGCELIHVVAPSNDPMLPSNGRSAAATPSVRAARSLPVCVDMSFPLFSERVADPFPGYRPVDAFPIPLSSARKSIFDARCVAARRYAGDAAAAPRIPLDPTGRRTRSVT